MKTFKDVYKLPFEKHIPEDTWVYDQKIIFVFNLKRIEIRSMTNF